jgi:hypothetical protein
MSLPSNWKSIEMSESLVTEILSTGDISSDFLQRLPCHGKRYAIDNSASRKGYVAD